MSDGIYHSGGRKVVAILQARMRSRRLPGKVLADLGGTNALELMARRIGTAKTIDEVWVATSTRPEDDEIVRACEAMGVHVMRGDETDVLKRYWDAAAMAEADVVLRLTADCPCVDPDVLDDATRLYLKGDADYVSNVIERSYPDGLDVEVFSREVLEETNAMCSDPRMREHVTPYMRTGVYKGQSSGNYTVAHLKAPADFSNLRWTLDEPDDLDFFRAVLPELPQGFSWLELVALLSRRPDLLAYNRQKKWRIGALADLRREDANGLPNATTVDDRYSESNAFFKRALKTVPLASQTFSKSYQQYVLGAAPLFLQRGKGCKVEDIDGNGYIDYVSGLLSIVLGYCDPDVDAAIMRQLENGISFSLATRLETELSETLKRLIPCCEMVRFGKNGSDATTAAIRLARAHTGRDKVIVGGYHGWHDWYIGTTTRDLGVPGVVRALTETVPFGDANRIEALLKESPDAYAALIIEPAGVSAPPDGYLRDVRELCSKYGTVLVFDEIVTGFRIDIGGAQTLYGVTPDLACFGKSMGNGMPISAIVGCQEIMQKMESIFFSTTFGGEALSLAASIATIEKLEREDVPRKLRHFGEDMIGELNQCLDDVGLGDMLRYGGEGWWPRLSMSASGIPATTFASLLRQSINANGLLLGSSLNLSRAHLEPAVKGETLKRYRSAVSEFKSCLDSDAPEKLLRGKPIQPTFQVRS